MTAIVLSLLLAVAVVAAWRGGRLWQRFVDDGRFLVVLAHLGKRAPDAVADLGGPGARLDLAARLARQAHARERESRRA